MLIKVIGFLAFVFLVIYSGLYYSMGWFDSLSLLLVGGGSCIIWSIWYFTHRRWSFFIRNISVIIGLVYGLVWGIEIIVINRMDVIVIAGIPVGYGFFIGIIFDCFMAKKEKHERNID